ncbi:MAG: transcriptional regulator MraZ [Cereibacter sphaeroides]|uniref:Transcriptional regulator MraZ n=1 Tax=Cereibacter sphaeroides TaxID=1063 RepID=A0A2W5S530_CERSP|nr:MAG: transcriptional regulator MraZ [Cereibacter sphaeroides]
MSESFRGELSQKVDSKARVSIPAAFRRVLESGDPSFPDSPRPRVVMVYGDARRRFAECFTITEMRRIEAAIARRKKGDPARRFLERNVISQSVTVEVDEDGRIVLPQKVREKIGVSTDDMQGGFEAIFAGTLESFQVWKRDAYDDEVASQSADDLPELADGSDMFSLLEDDEPEA